MEYFTYHKSLRSLIGGCIGQSQHRLSGGAAPVIAWSFCFASLLLPLSVCRYVVTFQRSCVSHISPSLGRSVIPLIESWRMFVKRARPRQHTCMTLCVYVQCIVGRCCCVLDRRGRTDVFLDIHQTDPLRLFWISLFVLLTV